MITNESQNLNLDCVLHNSEACMSCGPPKQRRLEIWSPLICSFKFNIDRVARGNLGKAGIGVLCNYDCEVLLTFSQFVGVKGSNEVEILAILEALRLYYMCVLSNALIVESDSYM